MSIWGKIIGGVAGFAVGGPLGALFGGLAGHAVDGMRADAQNRDVNTQIPPGAGGTDGAFDPMSDSNTRKIAFTIGCIALGAKMAKADGVVSASEVRAFKEVFQVPPEEMTNVARVFDQARRDSQGFELYAKQMARMFSDNPAVLEELLGSLFHIAKADNVVKPEEEQFLRTCSDIFGFSDTDWRRIRAAHLGPDLSDPYTILGLEPTASDDAVKSAWRRLARENHPDKLMADGVPQEFIAVATEKIATINVAYEKIAKERGMN